MNRDAAHPSPTGGLGSSEDIEVAPSSLWTRSVKSLARVLALVLVGWRLAAYRVSSRLVGGEKAFSAASEGIARIPGMRGVYQRQAFYRRTLAFCGEGVYFGWQTVLSKAGARIHSGVYIGRHCSLGLVELGDDAMLSDGVQVLSGRRQHGTEIQTGISYRDQAQAFRPVRIGSNAWIGTNAIIMDDVGASSIVGAGAVVVEAIPDSCLAAGVPALVKRTFGFIERDI